MTTPISSSSGAGLQDTLVSPAASGSANQTRASQSSAPLGAAMLMSEIPALAAASSVSQLELAFGQVMKNSTAVDPSTGQSEVSASADSQLGAALNSFLVQSGFSQQQADAAASSFAAQLAKGGPVDLSASFSETGTTASTASASYGSMWMSESSVSVTARPGSVSIHFDPTSGNLSISLGEQQTSATQSITETNAPSHLFLTVPAADIVTLLPGQDQDSDGASNAATIGQGSAQLSNNTSAPSNSDNSLQSVVAGLGFPKLLGVQEALDSLSRVARGAHPAGAPLGSSSAIEAPTQAQVAAAPVVAKIGFMQPLSVAMHDLKGHGTTLFKRPDGSTGAMSFEPTNVQA